MSSEDYVSAPYPTRSRLSQLARITAANSTANVNQQPDAILLRQSSSLLSDAARNGVPSDAGQQQQSIQRQTLISSSANILPGSTNSLRQSSNAMRQSTSSLSNNSVVATYGENGITSKAPDERKISAPWMIVIGVLVGVLVLAIIYVLLRRKGRPPTKGNSDPHGRGNASLSKDNYGSINQYGQNVAGATLVSSSANNNIEATASTTTTAAPPARKKRIDQVGAPGRIYHVDWSSVEQQLHSTDPTPFILMVHADWCSACKTAMPAYVEAASRAKRSIFMAVEDSHIPQTANDQYEWMANIKGYPTFFLFNTPDRTKPTIYTGSRTPEAFVSAIETL